MYIEFDAPAYELFVKLKLEIDNWAAENNIPYTTKLVKNNKFRLGLSKPEHFTVFFLTWNGPNYQVKNPDHY